MTLARGVTKGWQANRDPQDQWEYQAQRDHQANGVATAEMAHVDLLDQSVKRENLDILVFRETSALKETGATPVPPELWDLRDMMENRENKARQVRLDLKGNRD